MFTIVRREELTPTTFLWDVEAPDVAASAHAGQFVMVRLHDGSERVPLTIADFDPTAGTVTVVVQALGRSTAEMRDRYAAGDSIADFVGPLGVPPPIERVGHVALVGGGLGVAPIYPQLRAFAEAGNRTTVIVGFRSAELEFWHDRMAAIADRLIVCTDDGSAGRPGFVTDALAEVVADDRPDLVVAIGPLPMMRACAEVTRGPGVPTSVSLNSIMVDGTGMCGSCRVSIDGATRFACVDGPDFDAHRVDFDELVSRQRRFVHDERRASDDYEHRCAVEQQLFVEGRRTYKKLRQIEPTKVPMPERDPGARSRTFDEVSLGYSLSEALREAERCLQCSRPTCISGCPVSVDIPRFIRHLLVKDVDGALAVIQETNVLPSVCGRVCPQESQCESQCVIGRKLEPVAIGRLERFVGDHGRVAVTLPAEEPARIGPLHGSRVAVVGSGPAGLACAADLARAGVSVTVLEALHVAGGVLRYGIPSFRLPRDIIDREVDRLVELGVEFQTDVVVGRTFTVADLLGSRGFDAVFLGVGAGAPSFLGIPGENAGQVSSANEFLTRVNLMGADRFPHLDTPVGLGDDVVVVGAGNTAMDCLRVARRLGARRVRCIYRRSRAEAPARLEELRHAEEEGVEFLFLHNPREVLTDDQGDVRGMVVERMLLGEPDERGRRSPVGTGEIEELVCDSVIVALGTNPNPIVTRSTAGLQLDSRGYVAADPVTQATNLPGVFAGGDIVTGGATVILAMGAGRRAAAAIAAFLTGDRSATVDTVDTDTGDTVDTDTVHMGEHRCPRCRRPLSDGTDDGEAAVCCADAGVAWRCTSCDKRSEGFAFPYGRCPACDGVLELLANDSAQTVDHAGLAALRTAFEIELGGVGFYTEASTATTDPVLHDLFGRLAEMEREHLATLTRRYHVAVDDLGDAATGHALHRATRHLGHHDVPDDPESLLRVAIELEERAHYLFLQTAPADDEHPVAARLYRELAAEEGEHIALLSTELSAWLDGRPSLL
ncbi:MAG: NADPH-dependent glutamate synthase [Actinobacteria bacterium]|nr:NADPH-dependent glutamate synthase [Actinomycetota bacterium]